MLAARMTFSIIARLQWEVNIVWYTCLHMIHFVCSPSSSCQAGISPHHVAGISAILQASSFCCRWSALNITCLQLLGVCLVSSQLALPWEIYATSLQTPPAEHHRPNQRAPLIDDDDLSKAYSRVSKCSIHALCETELAHLLRTVASACLCASPVNVESCQIVKSVIIISYIYVIYIYI